MVNTYKKIKKKMESLNRLVLEFWKVRCKFHSVAAMILMAILMAIVYLTSHGTSLIAEERMVEKSMASCDLFSGKWVFDNKSVPLYNETQCPFMTDGYSCQKWGRKEFKYQYWRWQPHDCDLPRFNGTTLLEELRNKRVVFVGDSLGKNQWVSLLCLIDSWILDPSQKVSQWHGSLITFKALEYNASIDFYWEPLLVESNGDDPIQHRVPNRVVRVENIEKHARQWIDADMLIFISYTWWIKRDMTLLWGSFENPKKIRIESSWQPRYKLAIETWSNWLEAHLNRTKTRVFFTGASPCHELPNIWGGSSRNCHGETEPILEEGYWGNATDIGLRKIVESAIKRLRSRGVKAQFLNVTQLSSYRKDGHPSIYKRHWVPPTEEELADPVQYSDCVHWCLPGVPDVWNQILYSNILQYYS